NKPGEIATTAGTSGVVYGVQNNLSTDPLSRVNAFAHVNHTSHDPRVGILLCVNGTGIANSWFRKLVSTGCEVSYDILNSMAAYSSIGSEGIQFFPFGNGTERMLNNKLIQSHIQGLDFNRHRPEHLARAIQEGIVFALNYGTDILKANGLQPRTIKAGKANMFLSPVFRQMFSSLINVPLEFYDTDGAIGAARGAGIGCGYFTIENAFTHLQKIEEITPSNGEHHILIEYYHLWKNQLDSIISNK
ncbi:MAG: FGGY-family carbohydrate kinase, partial [Saprospiraceae bacterium]